VHPFGGLGENSQAAIDLMLIEVVMPGMDGLQMVEKMETLVPFLINSTLGDDDPRVMRLIEFGAIGRVTPQSLPTDVESALAA
jgi:DNA-binding NarL/FixJ family response regulator